jgi:hypothetical protein
MIEAHCSDEVRRYAGWKLMRVAGTHRWARTVAGITALLATLLLLAACSASPNQPFSKSSLGDGGSGRIPPTIAIIAMNGVPPDRAGVLADALAEEAGLRDVAIVQGNFSDGYQLAGNFQAVFEGGGVRVIYTWVLTGNTGGELHRINGQELVAAPNSDPWAGVSDIILKRMASVTAESLSTRLAQLGFKVRQAGVMPPTHTFAQAGPGAEKEFDLETYYGSGSPLATASITPDELYTMTPEELDERLTVVAQKQAQERLRDAGVNSIEELMGETDEAAEKATPTVSAKKFAKSGKASRLASRSTSAPEREQLATARPAPDAKTDLGDMQSFADRSGRGGIDKVALVGVTGSPGRGNDELYLAMRKVLRNAGWPVVKRPGKTTLSISGRVAFTAPKSGVQQVKLAWAVTLPTGKVLGTVRQANDVPAGSLNKGWGQTAGYAAEAAAEGIFNLVEQVRSK